MLCNGFRPEAIIRACVEFMHGDVDGQSKRFAPTPTEFVDVARRVDNLIGAVERAKSRPALPKPKEPAPISEQERERVAAKMRAYCDELKRTAEAEMLDGGDRDEFRRSLFERGNQGIGPTALEILQRSGRVERTAQ